AGDAASALKLVAGATVQEGKYAVIRGLPDRYVNSQMNAVRLPSADEDKRAVQLDQFPSAMIESVQVSKTFTPDQQGDASGGAVNVVLKKIPDVKICKVKVGTGVNTQVLRAGEKFLTYKEGGVNFLGIDDGRREVPSDGNFVGAVGVTREDAPIDVSTEISAGGKHVFNDLVTVGGFTNLFYKRDSSYYEDGIDDNLWVEQGAEELTPRYEQGSPFHDDFKTSLFDVTQGVEEVQWGWLAVVGMEVQEQAVDMLYMVTRNTEDKAMLLEDTRGKEFFYPGYDPDGPDSPGYNIPDGAPYIRTETLTYTERQTQTFQLRGEHTVPAPDIELSRFFSILPPEFDWTLAWSSSKQHEPDKRQFGSIWIPEVFGVSARHMQFKPSATFTLGNLQRVWKKIDEESEQYFWNGKIPFKQWSGDEGYVKLGTFRDQVDRTYEQDSFSNFNDNSAFFEGEFDQFWSEQFPFEEHPTSAAEIDVDYVGKQEIRAWYYMVDLPLCPLVRVIGGVRREDTKLSVINTPEEQVKWVEPGTKIAVRLDPGEADVDFRQEDVLPSLGVVVTPLKGLTLRSSYTETVARQTFKEITPIQQQEFLGADVFIGNPDLKMSALQNYDVRLDYTPYDGGFFSFSWFRKDIRAPIEYVQSRTAAFGFTTPVNYPHGEIRGYEIETRQHLGYFWKPLEGLSLGGNAAFIDSVVTLPEEEARDLENRGFPQPTRDMINAPERLFNAFLLYELEQIGFQVGVFYTVRGDTLVAGAGQASSRFIPSLYETEFGTLNLSISQKIGDNGKLTFSAKNLLDPQIQQVYRDERLEGDTVKTSYTKGIDYSLSCTLQW
ncbi:MAG: TonB-dependent receptor, partial [Candidatus Omnitrophica bacterium]|nr:TonB-dependent receptor [Candidatus Omnitrophota bacterium]